MVIRRGRLGAHRPGAALRRRPGWRLPRSRSPGRCLAARGRQPLHAQHMPRRRRAEARRNSRRLGRPRRNLRRHRGSGGWDRPDRLVPDWQGRPYLAARGADCDGHCGAADSVLRDGLQSGGPSRPVRRAARSSGRQPAVPARRPAAGDRGECGLSGLHRRARRRPGHAVPAVPALAAGRAPAGPAGIGRDGQRERRVRGADCARLDRRRKVSPGPRRSSCCG